MPSPILEFQRNNRFLSNFYPAEFVWDMIVWPSSEHAYQAAKSADRATRIAISKVTDPGTVKRIGRGTKFDVDGKSYKVVVRPEWDSIKIATMEEIVREKFKQNGDLAHRLLDTGDVVLEEGNRWKDKFWGVCPPGSGDGRNELGKILMKIREETKSWHIIFPSSVEPTHFTTKQIKEAVWGIKND